MRRQILAAFITAFVIPLQVLAHAVLLAAVPSANEAIDGPDIDVQLHFNCRIDSGRSRLALCLPDRTVRPLTVLEADRGVLRSRATGLAAGDYLLRWQVLAADGHITRGEVPFSVK